VKECDRQGLGPKDTVMEMLPLCTGSLPKMERIKPRTRESYLPLESHATKTKQKKDHPVAVPAIQDDLDGMDEPTGKRSPRRIRASTTTYVSTSDSGLIRPTHDTSEEKEQEFDMDITSSPTSTPSSSPIPTPSPLSILALAQTPVPPTTAPSSHVSSSPVPAPRFTPKSISRSTPTTNSSKKRNKRASNPEKLLDFTSSQNLRTKLKRDRPGALTQAFTNESITKVLACEFPAEIFNGTNVDPSLKDDYLTVFTPDGSHVTTSNPSIVTMVDDTKVTNNLTTDVEEDGNVDYCLICNESGGIICCDNCPRGFHDECLNIQGKELPDSWECPRCKIDETEQDGDIKMGDPETYRKIAKTFTKLEDCDDFSVNVALLSKIHEILTYLMDYDFGHIFSDPVDCDAFPEYKNAVTRPMDLGTICENLSTVTIYTKIVKTKKKSRGSIMDMIVLEVLKDVERVWHNCFSYNYEGSAVYRMAEVQRKRCYVLRKCSIDKHLKPFILQELGKFVRVCETKRQKIEIASVEGTLWPKSNYNYDSTVSPHKAKKKVGVFDTETNMLVKQYSTLASAAHIAVYMCKKLGHNSGLRNMNFTSVKTAIRNSSKDPSLLIFGYRWLFVQELRDGIFFVDHTNPKCAEGSTNKSEGSNTVINKTCLTTQVTLATFSSISGAYTDWSESLKGSIDSVQDPTFLTFKHNYLDTNHSIDNAVWETVSPRMESCTGGQQQERAAVDHKKDTWKAVRLSRSTQAFHSTETLKKNSNASQHEQISRINMVHIESLAAKDINTNDSEQRLSEDLSFALKPSSSSPILATTVYNTEFTSPSFNNSNILAQRVGTTVRSPGEITTSSRSFNDDPAQIKSGSNLLEFKAISKIAACEEATMHPSVATTNYSRSGNGIEHLRSSVPTSQLIEQKQSIEKKRSRNFGQNNIISKKARGKNHDDDDDHASEIQDSFMS